jgi:predicted TIM-barrel fold metal-dependent hydrolase
VRASLKFLCLIGFFTASLIAATVAPSRAQELPLIDAHSQIDHKVDPGDVIGWMDKAGIGHVILSARGKATAEDIIALARRHPGRITPSVRTKGGIYRKDKPRYYEVLEAQLNTDGFGAMAEVILWHAQKGGKAPRVVVPPDDRRVRTALLAAVTRKWPFVVHIEFAAAGADRERFMVNLEAMLRQFPTHPFLLIHMGQLPAGEVGRLIGKFPNILFITSHANPITVAASR